MINRLFKLPKVLSIFLFGSRGTGKTTLLKEQFKSLNVFWVDLLDLNILGRYEADPMLLSREIDEYSKKNKIDWIVIDEVQRIPALLDIVHKLIVDRNLRFALTGSSARKLKRGAANLLGGSALQNYLYPLTHIELKETFCLDFVLRWGSLPTVLQLEDDEKKSI